MKNADRSPTRWFAAWRSRPAATPLPDPADCGTAFGMELSFPGDPAPALPAPAARQGWRQRWAARRRSA